MRLMLSFFSAYPWHSVIMLLALLFAGIAEGVGLSALLPLISIAIKNDVGESANTDRQPANEYEQMVIDALQQAGISPGIGVLLSIIVLGVTLKSLLLLVAKKQVGYTAAQVATDLRLEMLRVMLRSKWEYFIHQPIGRLTNRLATEAQRSSESFVNGATVITYLVQAIIYGGVAVAVSWKATLTTLAVGSVIIGISHFLVRMTRRAGKKQTRLLTSLLSQLTDTLQSVKPLKAMSKEHLADKVLATETTRLNKAFRKQVFSSAALNAAQEEMFAIVVAGGMFIALVKLGMPVATVTVLAVVLGKMLSQLGKVQKQYQKMVVGESAFWSLKDAIEEARQAEEYLGEGVTPGLETGIRLDHVTFSYDPGRPVLRNISIDIPQGQLTTLTGPSGSGKTTVIDLVIGLLKPQDGHVLIDDVPLNKLDMRAWRRMIGYVPQETLLLHASIAHNVTLGDPELGEQDAIRALKEAGAWDFIAHLPDSIHSTVGERGTKFSGGQRQRIMIARALVHKPRLLILDEATSALDPENEAAIGRTMEALRGKLTILAISHQTALVEAADCVYRMENGSAVKVRGTHTT
ncbi:ATP-binding cassette subfamily C protein [Thiogranum longum]|uniref:ATP-binding cassette subfamily C protein n=1 Tax=Thiogranum longum TaxID=1537524 RepID=A0A4R1HAU2_9GAMM|nr:ABC transporter ATP-binding protein [Thiogranum longum]TCK19084.1 ATP-binding cassette subfamily C protein [Thiogranum longum]